MGLEDYQEGRFPAVCIFSGEAADEVLHYQTPATRRPGDGRLGPLTGALERIVGFLGASRTYHGLAGRLPVSRRHYRRLQRNRRFWNTSVAVGVVMLVSAAWIGAWWSPPAALVSGAVIAVSVWHRAGWRRRFPQPVPSHAGTIVTIHNVHDSFASAVSPR